jgi:hypothetical protein
VHLLVSLAGPVPSGSTSTSRRCQGCFLPSPASPGLGCPQLQSSRCDDSTAESFHLRTVMKRLVAHDFHVPHIRVTTGLGALFTPRPSGAHTTGPIPPAAARPLYQGPGLITPAFIPSPGLSITRRHQGFIHIHPPGLPPCLWSPDGSRTSWACSPGFAPQQAGPAAHARAGDGHRALARSYTTDIVGPPIHELTRNVRPRVARSAWT